MKCRRHRTRQTKKSRLERFALGALILAGSLMAVRVFVNTSVYQQDLPLVEPAGNTQASKPASERPSDEVRNAALSSSGADDEPGVAAAQPDDSELQAPKPDALASSDQRRSESVSLPSDPIAVSQPSSSANTKMPPEAQTVHNGGGDLTASNQPRATQHSGSSLLVLEEERSTGYSEYSSSLPDMAKPETGEDSTDAVFTPNVARAQFSTEVVEREPVDHIGAVLPLDGEPFTTVYYFTEIENMSGQTVTHRWEYSGSVIAEVSLDIGSDRWRTWSSKVLTPTLTGQWRVSVVGADGSVLRTDSFVYADF